MAVPDLALLLTLIHLNDDKIEGRKRLQKQVCILKYGAKIPFNYEFRSYYYGPYSDNLTEAIDTLTSLGFIKERREMLTDYISKYVYELTDDGKKKVSSVLIKMKKNNPQLLSKLNSSVNELKTKRTDELVIKSKEVSHLTSLS
ncbi:MAG TPA: hypothetical protein VJR22_02580 [Candidatus Nitrosotalea sp.]|nr:hypothetical protein [Candidatus Nitrosotalea sp.]